MSKVAKLLNVYREHIAVPWQPGLAGIQRVIFAVYDPHDELRMRANLVEFEIATKAAGHTGSSSTSRMPSPPGWPASVVLNVLFTAGTPILLT